LTSAPRPEVFDARNKKSRITGISLDISVTRLSHRDPVAFRPTLTDGLVLSSICCQRLLLRCQGNSIYQPACQAANWH
jgi:hypothetical protein